MVKTDVKGPATYVEFVNKVPTLPPPQLAYTGRADIFIRYKDKLTEAWQTAGNIGKSELA